MSTVKRTLVVVSLLAAPIGLESQELTNSAPEKFSNEVARWLVARHVDVTEEQKNAFRIVQPLLVTISDDYEFSRTFWRSVRGGISQPVSWKEAVQLVLTGRVVAVYQNHNLTVYLVTTAGFAYRTEESKLDEILQVLRQVDPKNVLIRYMTE